jgi:hypothetical protein
MYWGPGQSQAWYDQKPGLESNPPQHLMAFNEPDVSSQSGMDATYAAQLYMQEIQPFGSKGTKLGSPAIVFDADWMATFLQNLDEEGGYIDFMCIHWSVTHHWMKRLMSAETIFRYGSWDDFAGFQEWVTSVYNRFGKTLWITEMGITTASGPSQANVQSFMIQAMNWLDSLDYVERVAWFGE